MDLQRSGEQGGGTVLSVCKRTRLAVRKRAVGKPVLGDEEQKEKKRLWGHCWVIIPREDVMDRAGAWYKLTVGVALPAIAGDPHGLGLRFL